MTRFTVKDAEKWILFEDEDIILVHKPAGVAVQNASLHMPDLESILKNRLRGGYLAVVHRLDQPVEGLVLFAKTPASAGNLGQQLQKGRMHKEYLAVVCLPEADGPGSLVPGDWRRLEEWILKVPRTNLSKVVPEGTGGARKAVLDYCLLEKREDMRRALLAVRLETGRHHQIRVQLAHAGLPIAGDRKYGKEDGNEAPLGLCAARLEFIHPRTMRKMSFTAEPQGEAFAENLWTKSRKSV